MEVNGILAGPTTHFEISRYFLLSEFDISEFYCIYIYIYMVIRMLWDVSGCFTVYVYKP